MRKYSDQYITYERTNSMMNLRQYLLPADTNQSKEHWISTHNLDPNILAAIADISSQSGSPTIQQRLISLYKKLGKTLRPDDLIVLAWNVLLVIIIIYFIIQLGLIFAFQQEFWHDELSLLVGLQIFFLVVLAVDILICPLKEYYDQGLLIKDVSLIFRKYVRLEFWLDIVAFLVILLPLVSSNISVNWIKLLWFVKLYSLSNIFAEYQRLTQLSLILNTLFLVLKLIIYTYLYAHSMGIFFYKISNSLYQSNYYGPNTPNIVWVYKSWAFYQLIFLPWYQIYLYIIYFSLAVVTTIAYGDITPKNPIQCGYMIAAFTFQTLLWGYILSEILRLLINIYTYNFQRKYHHYALNFKLKTNLVSSKTFQKVQKHTQQIDRDEQYRNRQVQEKFLELLPPDPLYGMLLLIYKQFLQQIGFSFVSRLRYKSLGSADQKSIFLQNFTKKIKEVRHFAGDILYIQGEQQNFKPENHCAYCFTDAIYSQSVILGLGELISLNNLDDSLNYENTCKGASFELKRPNRNFGQMQFLTGEKRSHWAVCVKNCLLFVAPRCILRENYSLLTIQEKQIIALHTQRVNFSSCLICREEHYFKNCPYVFAIPDELTENSKTGRVLVSRIEQRTRMKTLNSWQLYPSIKNTKMKLTKRYKQQLFYDKSAHSLFVSLQLQQKEEKQHDQEQGLQHEIFTTQYIMESIYHKELQELGLSQQQLSYDTAYNFTHYKPSNNVEQIANEYSKSQKCPKKKRHAFNLY